MVSRTKRALATGLAIAALATLPAAALAGVVVSASGPSAASFPAGKRIGDDERIVLRRGDTLTVHDGKGTRVQRGARTFTLGQQAGESRRSRIAELTERRATRRVTTGASRGELEDSLAPPNLWYVDINRPGRNCLADTERVRLWRGQAEGEAAYTVRIAGGSGGQTIEYSDGEILAAWDKLALPIEAGAEYQVSSQRGALDGALSFVVLEYVADEPEDLAAQLIENGCTRQLELLTSATMLGGE